MGECKACGKCCSVIVLNIPLQKVREVAKTGDSDTIFVLRYWKVISLKKARQINPYYVKQVESTKAVFTRTYYTCTKFNPRTNHCRVHNHKPGICKNYPYYGRAVISSDFQFPSEKCGYIEERKYDEVIGA